MFLLQIEIRLVSTQTHTHQSEHLPTDSKQLFVSFSLSLCIFTMGQAYEMSLVSISITSYIIFVMIIITI